MTDQTAPTVPADPAPAAEKPSIVARFATMVVGWFKSLFGSTVPAMTWATGWALTLTGVSFVWSAILVIARNPGTLAVIVPLAIGAYLHGHNESDRAWKPAVAAMKAANVKLAGEVVELKKPRPVPVCLPAAPAATPAPAVAPKASPRRKQAASKAWWQ